jgi:phosphoribosylglycinamide formyltransferase-1
VTEGLADAPRARRRVGVLISGRGSNMMALIEAARAPDYPAEIVLVISNRPSAPGLERAQAMGVKTLAIDHKAYATREAFDDAVDAALAAERIDLVCHAGFMRIQSDGFARRWLGRQLNIHPSLLPLFKGLHPQKQALDAGVRLSGCTVHFVTPDLDGGPIIAQGAVPVVDGDTPETLAERILAVEHAIYPQALALVAAGAARLAGDRVILYRTVNQSGRLISPDVALAR